MPVLKLKTWNIEDAVSGEVIRGGFLSEKFAEDKLPKIRRKHPAAFVKKAE